MSSLRTQNTYEAQWKRLDSSARTHVVPSIEEAIDLINRASPNEVLFTGSLHLVGAVLAFKR